MQVHADERRSSNTVTGPPDPAPHSFRLEIAGLRAIAVISVVLFHLRISGTQGGFVGVDVFFVISGYLISRNILAGLAKDRFSLREFYIRRIRRIYPALIFTVLATYVAGFLWSSPLMFADLAKECTYALLSIANIQYWRQSHNYFAPASDELALLHVWSLSLEEQFYLIWPVLVALAYRLKRTFEAISIAAIASLVGAALIARTDSSAAFFLMPFRIFEFAAGATVLLAEKKLCHASLLLREGVSVIGLVCILSSVLSFNSNMPHLEIAMLLPCLGASAIIWAAGPPLFSTMIANPFMIGIGAISYSLYLCHWPIIFFGKFIFGDAADTPLATLITVSSMIVVATAMYFLVERRFIQSRQRQTSLLRSAAGFTAAVLLLVAITHATVFLKGMPWRLPEAQAELAHLQDFPNYRDVIPIEGPLQFELVGDSFATQYIAGLSILAKRLEMKFDVLGASGCPILYGAQLKSLRRQVCIQARDETLRRLDQTNLPTNLPIIFAQKWRTYSDALIDLEGDTGTASGSDTFTKLRSATERTIERLTANGRRILIVGDQIQAGCDTNPARLLPGLLPHKPLSCPPNTKEIMERWNAPINQMLADIQARWPDRVQLFRPVDYFCDPECPVVRDGIWLYYNSTHFSVAGSKYIVARSESMFRNFLKNEAKPNGLSTPN